MLFRKGPRQRLVALALALALACTAPVKLAAQTPDAPAVPGAPGAADTFYGACMAVICGASINIGRHVFIPIVWGVAVASCAAAMLDAMSSPDPE